MGLSLSSGVGFVGVMGKEKRIAAFAALSAPSPWGRTPRGIAASETPSGPRFRGCTMLKRDIRLTACALTLFVENLGDVDVALVALTEVITWLVFYDM